MRNAAITLILLLMLLNFTGCNVGKIPLPKYTSKECYYSEGIQDYTDYCKYFYDEEKIKEFKDNNYFNIVEESDIENIKSYFLCFEERVNGESFSDKYDFNCNTQIKIGDYFYIRTKEGMKIGNDYYEKFNNYDVYYVDTEKRILYYIHTNL